MTRRYEIVYIFDSANEETQIDKHLERFHALLKSKENPDPITNVNHWGKRSLAYPIAGNKIGYYVVVAFSTDPTLLPEFERLVKLEEAAIRYQIVLNEGEVPVTAPLPGAGGDDRESKESGSPSAGEAKKSTEGSSEEAKASAESSSEEAKASAESSSEEAKASAESSSEEAKASAESGSQSDEETKE